MGLGEPRSRDLVMEMFETRRVKPITGSYGTVTCDQLIRGWRLRESSTWSRITSFADMNDHLKFFCFVLFGGSPSYQRLTLRCPKNRISRPHWYSLPLLYVYLLRRYLFLT